MTSSKGVDEVAFRFKLPSDGLALRAVAIVDNTPELRFGASPKVPTITEEDVAAAVRLAMENRRPEFYYYGFPSTHPFYGRQYKHYSPQWLRKTSLGDLLSEVDWMMKCLYVGTKSDETKASFFSWPKTSQLDGLATAIDFPTDKPCGSVIMSCESVKVQESDNELMFLDEPKMRIDSQSSLVYSKYLTAIYDSVAYHDEPLFLKMREVPKLILAAEWLKKKGVKMSQEWMMKCTTKPRQAVSQAIDVRGPTMTKNDIRQILEHWLPHSSRKEQIGVLGRFLVDTKVKENDVSEQSLQFEVTKTLSLGCMPPLTRTLVVRASVNDYDMLYSGIDPNMPVCMDASGELVTPNVQSWSELFSETVPWPSTWLVVPYIGIGIPAASGGVSTREIPVTEVAACHSKSSSREADQIAVPAQKGRGKKSMRPPRKMIPQPTEVERPRKDVSVHTREAEENRALSRSGVAQQHGWQELGGGEVFEQDGTSSMQQRSLKVVAEETTGESRMVLQRKFISIPLPPTIATPQSESQSVAQPVGATLPSPSSSMVSDESGFASLSNEPRYNLPHAMNSPMFNQPAGVTDKDSSSSAGSNDSGITSPSNELTGSESSNSSSDETDQMTD